MHKTAILLVLMLCVALTASVGTAANERVLAIEFSIDKQDVVKLLDMTAYEGVPSVDPAGETEYSLVILSDAGQILHTVKFEAIFTAWADGDTNGFPLMPDQVENIGAHGSVDLDEIQVLLRVPFFDNAARFQIKKSDAVLLEEVIDLCNEDGTCQPDRGENFLSCYQDCPSGSEDKLCDEAFDGKCDPDCKAQAREEKDTDCTCGNGVCDPREDSFYCEADCGAPANTLLMTIIGIIAVPIIIIILIIVVVVKRRGKKKKKD